jgi:hypothetical protein
LGYIFSSLLGPLEGVRRALKGVLGLNVRMSPGPPAAADHGKELPETCSFLPNVTPNGFPRLLGPQAVVRASKGVDHPHEHFVVHGHVVESRRAERMEKRPVALLEPLRAAGLRRTAQWRLRTSPLSGIDAAGRAYRVRVCIGLYRLYSSHTRFCERRPPSFTPRAFARKAPGRARP